MSFDTTTGVLISQNGLKYYPGISEAYIAEEYNKLFLLLKAQDVYAILITHPTNTHRWSSLCVYSNGIGCLAIRQDNMIVRRYVYTGYESKFSFENMFGNNINDSIIHFIKSIY